MRISKALSPVFALLLALAVLPLCASSQAFADNEPQAVLTNTEAFADNDLQAESSQAKRTIMFYACGTNLETDAGMASYNLRQILAANFSADDDVRFIVMTGGAEKWQLESSYLYDPANPKKAPEAISNEYNQIWEAKGLDAPKNPGKLVLLDGDGLSGDGENAKTSAQEQMVQPETLQGFINYCVENFPAEKYDLILWDHGGGPRGGYGQDDHHSWNDEFENTLSTAQLIEVFENNAVTSGGGRFDFINFDACVMNSIELNLAFADYTDYYIASPEYIPGYGQNYTGWLNAVGKDPSIDTFALGKIMVDDFISFYDKPEGDGSSQEGTLAIVNSQALMNSGIVDALIDMNDILRSQALTPNGGQYLFYNELNAAAHSISYGSLTGYDLGNFVSLLAINFVEAHAEDVENGTYSDTNEYLDVAKRILTILNDPKIMYAGGTSGIVADSNFQLTPNGNVTYDELYTSGTYITFTNVSAPRAAKMYLETISDIVAAMPQDNRTKFLSDYALTLNYYALLCHTGAAIDDLVNGGYGNYKTLPKNEINYDEVKAFWSRLGKYSDWHFSIGPLMDLLGGEEAVKPWISAVILQQAAEAVSKDNVTSWEIEGAEGTAYKIKIAETAKRLTTDVTCQLIAELPMVRDYIAQQEDGDAKESLTYMAEANPLVIDISYGARDWDMSWDGIETDDDLLKAYIEWFNNDTSLWNMPAREEKWWAIQDAEGNLHVADYSGGNPVYIPVILEKQNGVEVPPDAAGNPQLLVLVFKDNKLSELRFITDPETMDFRAVMASDLTSTLEVLSVQYIGGMFSGYTLLPISETRFTVTGENADSISLVYTDIANISDIADTTDDEVSVSKRFVVTDIYSNEIDITEQVLAHANGKLRNIDLAEIKPATYTGKPLVPVVVDGDKILVEGVDYDWDLRNEDDNLVDVGEHWIRLYGMGKYCDAYGMVFQIVAPADTAWTRLSGDNALKTMDAIVDAGSFEKGGTVVLASLEGYWDALTAAGIAGLENAPVLMALQDGLGDQTAAQLKKLAPKKIIVCGGTYWIPDSVVAEACKAAGIPADAATRLAGDVAVSTAEKVVDAGKGKWAGTAIVATVGTFQDALAAAPVAYAKHMPIYLAQYDFATGTGSLSQSTIDNMKANGIKNVYFAGGTYWMPKAAEKQLADAGITVIARLAGDTAVETSTAIAREAFDKLGMNANDVGLANVAEHYDALASAAFCGKAGSVLLLASDTNRSSIADFVKPNALAIGHGYVFGGEASVSADTMAAAVAAASAEGAAK